MKFRPRWAATALFVVASGVSTLAHAYSVVPVQGTWGTTLQARTFDGGDTIGGYYDTDLNITWLANANANGGMFWSTANSWAAGLNLNGITGWRLPTTGPVNGSSYNYNFSFNGSTDYAYNISAPGSAYPGSTGSEMAHMFYVTLGDKAYYNTSGNPQAGFGLTNTGPFSNVQSYYYWSATWYEPDGGLAWYFDTSYGEQYHISQNSILPAWAVHAGDVGAAVATVPVPAAVWLFGSGLLGLIGVARRKAA